MANSVATTDRPDSELIIGLVSAVGTENSRVIELLKEQLGHAGYRAEKIKVSEMIIPSLIQVPNDITDQYARISQFMDAGNNARSKAGNATVLSLGIASYISAFREKETGSQTAPLPKTAFIIDSLKRPEEVECLRSIYPSGFVLISVYSDAKQRLEHLRENRRIDEPRARELIRRDEDESGVEYGQRVSKTFHLADYFVKLSGRDGYLRGDIRRIVELWFGHPFHTPTFDEYSMHFAFSAALCSADLSRQVGAVIANKKQILATGANECPAFEGGHYWPNRDETTGRIEDLPRGRDYMRGIDSNREEQLNIIRNISEIAEKEGIDKNVIERVLLKSPIRDLTEYGRVVHAEMAALLSCSRAGIPTSGATLYCTTFPCHNCAKHIVSAGIERVVYVEPYPKSKALVFHDDSITTEDTASMVRFEPFVGIAPRRFFDHFSMQLGSNYDLIRKDDKTGKKMEWKIEDSRLRIQMTPLSYLQLEQTACKLFEAQKKSLEKLGPS